MYVLVPENGDKGRKQESGKETRDETKRPDETGNGRKLFLDFFFFSSSFFFENFQVSKKMLAVSSMSQ